MYEISTLRSLHCFARCFVVILLLVFCWFDVALPLQTIRRCFVFESSLLCRLLRLPRMMHADETERIKKNSLKSHKKRERNIKFLKKNECS